MKWVIRSGDNSHDVEVHRRRGGFEVFIDGISHSVDFLRLDASRASLRFTDDGRSFSIAHERPAKKTWRIGVGVREFLLDVLTPLEAIEKEASSNTKGPSKIEAPIPGKVVKINVSPGETVEPGQALVILEAMKMENDLIAEQGGIVSSIHIDEGMVVETGQLLVELE